MKKKTPAARIQDPENLAPEWPSWLVIIWLRTAEGERWSRARVGGSLERHWGNSGVFAEVITERYFGRAAANWPEPLESADLDRLEADPDYARALGY